MKRVFFILILFTVSIKSQEILSLNKGNSWMYHITDGSFASYWLSKVVTGEQIVEDGKTYTKIEVVPDLYHGSEKWGVDDNQFYFSELDFIKNMPIAFDGSLLSDTSFSLIEVENVTIDSYGETFDGQKWTVSIEDASVTSSSTITFARGLGPVEITNSANYITGQTSYDRIYLYYAYIDGKYYEREHDEEYLESFDLYISLSQNFPNPFNNVTEILYQTGKSTHLKLLVFDVNGRLVRTLVDDFRVAGMYSVTFDATGLASGVYFYRLIVENKSETRKMIILR